MECLPNPERNPETRERLATPAISSNIRESEVYQYPIPLESRSVRERVDRKFWGLSHCGPIRSALAQQDVYWLDAQRRVTSSAIHDARSNLNRRGWLDEHAPRLVYMERLIGRCLDPSEVGELERGDQ